MVMVQYEFYLDADNCIGYHTCQAACKAYNLAVGETKLTDDLLCIPVVATLRFY